MTLVYLFGLITGQWVPTMWVFVLLLVADVVILAPAILAGLTVLWTSVMGMVTERLAER